MSGVQHARRRLPGATATWRRRSARSSSCCEREPGNTRAMSNLALVLHDQGRRRRRRAELTRKLERMEPNPPFAISSAAWRRCSEGNYTAGQGACSRKEVDRAAVLPRVPFLAGARRARPGRDREARKHMAIAVENSTTREDHDLYAAKLAPAASEGAGASGADRGARATPPKREGPRDRRPFVSEQGRRSGLLDLLQHLEDALGRTDEHALESLG